MNRMFLSYIYTTKYKYNTIIVCSYVVKETWYTDPQKEDVAVKWLMIQDTTSVVGVKLYTYLKIRDVNLDVADVCITNRYVIVILGIDVITVD